MIYAVHIIQKGSGSIFYKN